MKFADITIEAGTVPSFYFDTFEKVFTLENNSDCIPIYLKEEVANDKYKVRCIYKLLEFRSLNGHFDSCQDHASLAEMNI